MNPFPTLFAIFTSSDHLRVTLDEDGATMLGHAMDELARHHPGLKEDVQKAVKGMVEGVLGSGRQVVEHREEEKVGYKLARNRNDKDVKMVPDETKNEEKDPLVSQFIEICARVHLSSNFIV